MAVHEMESFGLFTPAQEDCFLFYGVSLYLEKKICFSKEFFFQRGDEEICITSVLRACFLQMAAYT